MTKTEIAHVSPSSSKLPKMIGPYKAMQAWVTGLALRAMYQHTRKKGPGRYFVAEVRTDGYLQTIAGNRLIERGRMKINCIPDTHGRVVGQRG